MIKAEVVFYGCKLSCNGYVFSCLDVYGYGINIYKNGNLVSRATTIEQAIKYCLEN